MLVGGTDYNDNGTVVCVFVGSTDYNDNGTVVCWRVLW